MESGGDPSHVYEAVWVVNAALLPHSKYNKHIASVIGGGTSLPMAGFLHTYP